MGKPKKNKGPHRTPGHVLLVSTRPYSAHHLLRATGAEAIRRGGLDRGVERHESLTAILMFALAIEALANTLFPRLVKGWKDFNNLKPVAKWRLIYAALGIDFDENNETWVGARWLLNLRNSIAHPMPDDVRTERILSPDEFNELTRGKVDFPPSDVEKQLTIANAKRAQKTFEAILESLSLRLHPEHGHGIFSDMMSGGASIIPPVDMQADAGTKKQRNK